MRHMIKIADLISLFGTPKNFDPSVSIGGVSIDSRDDVKGKVFFAIRGRKTDGHRYLKDVFKNGATSAFIDNPQFLDVEGGKNIFLVDDVVLALGKLGKFYLDKLPNVKKKIAITGSAGKTTTRYIISTLLSYKRKVFSSKRNLNTEIGVPLSIFDIPWDAEFLIFEFGADRPGDIAYLSELIRPDIGIITNIGPSHIERFGSLEEIGNTKWALAKSVESGGVLIYNGDDPILEKKALSYMGRKISYGSSNNSDVRLLRWGFSDIGENFTIFLDGKLLDYSVNLLGHANIYNTLAGISLIWYLFGDVEFIKEVLPTLSPPPGRLRLIKGLKNGILIIDDTYNSNPLSLKNSLSVLSRFKERRRVAILGDMLELGEFSTIYHREIGKDIALSHLADKILGIGNYTKFLIEGAMDFGFKDVEFFEERDDLLGFLLNNRQDNDVYLFKASRGIRLEDIMNKFMEKIND